MLPRKYRLQKKKDISRVFRYGQSFRSEQLSLRALPNGKTFLRVVIVVGKEIDKRSARRNRLKRVMGAGLSRLLPDIRSGSDVVIRLRADPQKANAATMHSALKELFERARLL